MFMVLLSLALGGELDRNVVDSPQSCEQLDQAITASAVGYEWEEGSRTCTRRCRNQSHVEMRVAPGRIDCDDPLLVFIVALVQSLEEVVHTNLAVAQALQTLADQAQDIRRQSRDLVTRQEMRQLRRINRDLEQIIQAHAGLITFTQGPAYDRRTVDIAEFSRATGELAGSVKQLDERLSPTILAINDRINSRAP